MRRTIGVRYSATPRNYGMESRKPWYYVPGRKDLTEKLLSRKREKEAQREQVCSETNKYFNRCNAQSKLYKQWENQKSLVHYKKEDGEGLPPFDVDETYYPKRDAFEHFDEARVSEAEESLKRSVQEIRRVELSAAALKAKGELYLQRIKCNVSTGTEYTGRCEAWKVKEKQLAYIRFARDRLRRRVFLLLEQLQFHKGVLDSLFSADDGHVFTIAEDVQLIAIVESASKLLDTYFHLNTQRNYEFVCMFK